LTEERRDMTMKRAKTLTATRLITTLFLKLIIPPL
jgi:hypothetical protein